MTSATLLDFDRPQLLDGPLAGARLGRPDALAREGALDVVRERISALPMSSTWRPSDPELAWATAALDGLGAQTVRLWETRLPSLELEARGPWTDADVGGVLARTVQPEIRRAFEDAGMRLPPGPTVRATADIDLRSDAASLTLARAVSVGPDALLTAQLQALCEHLGVEEAGTRWLASVHQNLVRSHQRVEISLTVRPSTLRRWVAVRYLAPPIAAARAVRGSVGVDPRNDPELDALLEARPGDTLEAIEVRVASQGGPRVRVLA